MDPDCLCTSYIAQLRRLYGDVIADLSVCEKMELPTARNYRVHFAHENEMGKVVVGDLEQYTEEEMVLMVANLKKRRVVK